MSAEKQDPLHALRRQVAKQHTIVHIRLSQEQMESLQRLADLLNTSLEDAIYRGLKMKLGRDPEFRVSQEALPPHEAISDADWLALLERMQSETEPPEVQ